MSKKKTITTILAIFLIVSLCAATAYALYAGADESVHLLRSSSFYFESDFLSDSDIPVYYISNFKTSTSKITFSLQNYMDELNVSETDISYSVSTDNENITAQTGTITVNGSTPVSQTVEISVPAACFTNGEATIRVTVTSTAPYTKTIEAIFVLQEYEGDINYTVVDSVGSNTLQLTITTALESGEVIIYYPSGTLPDNTDKLLYDITSTSCKYSASSNAQNTFVFFKNTPGSTYLSTDFSVAFTS